MKNKIILITGKQGSGKSTMADRITECMKPRIPFRRLKFADVIYEMHDAVLEIAEIHGIASPGIDGPLLQLLGTEWGRKTRGENIWVGVALGRVDRFHRANPEGIVLIDDARFLNELAAFPDAITVRLTASDEVRKIRCGTKWRPNTEHASEVGLDVLDDSLFTHVFDTTDYPDLGPVIEQILAEVHTS